MIARERPQLMSMTGRTWTFPRQLVLDHLAFAGLLWIGVVLVVTALVIGVAIWGSIDQSGWDVFVRIIPHWYVGCVSGFIAFSYLPSAIAHGQTRRDTAVQILIFTVVMAVALALLVVAGFLIERVLYGVMDWPQAVDAGQRYTSSGQVHLIFLQYAPQFLVWAAAGVLVGAGFYRSEGEGAFALFVSSLTLSVAGFVLESPSAAPFSALEWLFDPPGLHLGLAIVVCLITYVFSAAVAWGLISDIPVRNPKR